MGGTQDDHDSWNQLNNLAEELNVVNYAVYYTGNCRCVQYDRDALHKNVCKSISATLDTLGVKHKKNIDLEMGGGGILSLNDIFHTLIDSKEFFLFIASFYKLIMLSLNKISNLQTERDFPEIQVDYWIEANGKIGKIHTKELKSEISNRVSNLLGISNVIHQKLVDEFKIIKFNSSVKAQINIINFEAVFSMRDKYQSNFNLRRMIKMTQGLRIRNDYSYYYILTRLWSIKRSEWKSLEEDNTTVTVYHSDNYFFLSVSTVNDLFLK